MMIQHYGGDDYSLLDECGEEIMRGTYDEVMDWAFGDLRQSDEDE